MEFSEKDNEAVKWCEDTYPELTQEYKKVISSWHYLNFFCCTI